MENEDNIWNEPELNERVKQSLNVVSTIKNGEYRALKDVIENLAKWITYSEFSAELFPDGSLVFTKMPGCDGEGEGEGDDDGEDYD